ncbi:kinase-like domain-containing protein [Helicostylum pulchrum]|uniref:Protein kinase domain-containing protein n=1 Tax=Helicostylum pulchrum TaxID=562976 RepID=A0ABP9Y1J7_9FUNG|nr:kinase-like domain-containing protein [Helicostylum pulchrum]
MKDTFSSVPQEIHKRFLEPTHCKEHKKIYLDQFDEDDNSSDANSEETKQSFVRTLFSKLQFNDTPPPYEEDTRYLSMYGVLVNKRIGEGVSATVQLIQRDHDTTFAVKIFRKKKRREPLAIYMKALTSEFCISSALKHPNIIETLDFVRADEDHTRYCIIMEYCPEGDMYSLIKQGTMQIDEINSYFKQLLTGLDYLHSLGVAHRDLKPENLLIGKDSTLRIADFGSADVFRVAWQDHSRLSDGLCGTTPYMAPEIFHDQGYWAAPVDVWAAGIIFFCMRFDGVPFGSAQLDDINYPIYLRKRGFTSYAPFNKLELEPRLLLYAMLNPSSQQRITIQDLLNMPWIQTI